MVKKAKILLYGSNLWYVGEGLLGPLFAVFAEGIGGDVLDITWAWAIYLIVTGFLVIVVGNLTDKRWDKERTMVAGYALNAVFTFGYLFVTKPWHLFMVQIGLGIASALTIPTWSALYAHHGNEEERGRTWGLADGQANIITGFMMVLGGLIITLLSFRTLFIIMGCVQVIATIYQAKILFVHHHEHEELKKGRRKKRDKRK